jgi:hypothetical protein
MKYFTPELLARCRSQDDAVADAAAKEWEQASVAYRARLRALRHGLPLSARRLLAHYTLHDAKVLTMAFARKRLTVQLQLEGTRSQPGDVLELNYVTVLGSHGGVSIRKHALPQSSTVGSGWILYHEFDADEERAFFTHRFLFSSGHEVEFRFNDFSVRRLDDVLLQPLELQEGERTWPLVEA